MNSRTDWNGKEVAMKGMTLARTVAILASAMVFAGTAGTALAASRYIRKVVRVPYTYYAWETQTRYRTVRKPVRELTYRWEQRAVTTYHTESRWAAELYFDANGHAHTRSVLRPVRVPRVGYETVRVPVWTMRYKLVREPYTVRTRVKKTGYRTRTKLVRAPQPRRRVTTTHHPKRNPRPVSRTARPTTRGIRIAARR